MSNRESCISLLAEILEKIENLPRGPFWIRDIKEGKYTFPISLDVGNGRDIYIITPEIDGMLARFSKMVMDALFQSHKSDFTHSEWNKMIKRAFGNSLSSYDKVGTTEEGAKTILSIVEQKVDAWINNIQEYEYAFGCHLHNIPDLEPLSIGPVRFEPRLKWIERMQDKGHVSNVSRSRIERSWRGNRIRKRKPSVDEVYERRILDTIGDCEFVCSVVVGSMGSEAGLQKALTAARLAMTAIALVVGSRPSSVLNAMNLIFDRQPYLQDHVAFSPTGRWTNSSWSFLPGGVTWITAEEWMELQSKFRSLFDCVGEAIWCFMNGHSKAERPKTMEVIFQALLWFHEGCRESINSMAIVKFFSSMEALSRGKRIKGIKRLMQARLNIIDEKQLYADVKNLYNKGRSETVHGKNDRLGHNWSDSRNLSEILARECLIGCLRWAAENRETDDPKLFSQPKT